MNQNQFSLLKERAQIFRRDIPIQRINRLKRLLTWIEKHEVEIVDALHLDFRKPKFETLISEINPCMAEIQFALKKLPQWMTNKKVKTPFNLLGHKSYIRYENKGTVLIISPWNYPFQLAIVPLISAIAAGNTAVIKPSELTPNTSELIKKCIEACFYSNEVMVELGDKEKTQELLNYNFDHVFFTGSTTVGKIIAKKCADTLTPFSLELGGKSPTIVDGTANINEAVDKIFWGKFLNRSQTCVAPDYVLVHDSVYDLFEKKLQRLIDKSKTFDKAKIINEQHHSRLQKLAQSQINFNEETLELVEIQSVDHPLMKEEIFGPVLPIIRYHDNTDLHTYIDLNQKPLALYIFSKSKENINYVLQNFTSGSAGINSLIVQFANHHLPFGGVGPSGAGRYHGYYGFLEMSHIRSIIKQSYFSYLRKFLMPPYTKNKIKAIGFLNKF